MEWTGTPAVACAVIYAHVSEIFWTGRHLRLERVLLAAFGIAFSVNFACKNTACVASMRARIMFCAEYLNVAVRRLANDGRAVRPREPGVREYSSHTRRHRENCLKSIS